MSRLLARKTAAPWKLNVFIVELERERVIAFSWARSRAYYIQLNNETGLSDSAGKSLQEHSQQAVNIRRGWCRHFLHTLSTLTFGPPKKALPSFNASPHRGECIYMGLRLWGL